eukprot:1909564-Pleurochrysis_carterae.AAC.1
MLIRNKHPAFGVMQAQNRASTRLPSGLSRCNQSSRDYRTPGAKGTGMYTGRNRALGRDRARGGD